MNRLLTQAADFDFVGVDRTTDRCQALAIIPGKRGATVRRRCPSRIPRTVSGTAERVGDRETLRTPGEGAMGHRTDRRELVLPSSSRVPAPEFGRSSTDPRTNRVQ